MLAEISPFASTGKLKLVLRLDGPLLLERPETDPVRLPEPENEVLREDGASPSASIGNAARVGEVVALFRPSK